MNATDYRNRIVETGDADPRTLAPNPRNPRRHPKAQRGAMAGILEEVGWLEPVIYNRTTGRLVNGHLRVEEAIRHGDATVPVTYVEMDEATEALALVAFDRIGWMAENQADVLDALLRDVSTGNAAVQAMLAEMAADSAGIEVIGVEVMDDVARTTNNMQLLGKGERVGLQCGDLMVTISREHYERLYAYADDSSHESRAEAVEGIIDQCCR